MKLRRDIDGRKVTLTFEVDLAELNRIGLMEEFADIYAGGYQHAKLYADFLSKVFRTNPKKAPTNPVAEAFRQKFGADPSQFFNGGGFGFDMGGTSAAPKPPPQPDPAWCKVLGLPKTATKDEIKAKYRELAKRHHPDASGQSGEFEKIHQAYQEAMK